MIKVVRLAANILGWALVVSVLVAVWLHLSASRGTVTIYLTGVVPFALFAGVAAVCLFCLTRTWFALIPAVAAIVGLVWTQVPLWRAETAPTGSQVTVASSNLMLGEGSADAVVAQVRAGRVDLLSVQELTPTALTALRAAGLEQELPYSYVVPAAAAAGTGLFSRHPISELRKVDAMLLGNVIARVDLPGIGPTWFAALHPVPPINGLAGQWAFELGRLRDVLHALPGDRAIAAGDFNATWDYAQFRDLASDGYADATEQAGAGWVFTYPTDKVTGRPFVALDHVVSRGFVAHDIVRFDIEGSDHRGMVATLGTS